MSRRRTRIRFRIEVCLALIATCLAVITMFWHDWLEAFGFDPDNHSGSFEWTIIVGLFVLASVFATAAGIEWRVSRRPATEAG
jgi:uncharacterized membrane protein YphA (DoxX/SURF4 family)